MIDRLHPNFDNTPASTKRPRFKYILKDISGQPQVSIITPFYNTSRIFHETATSVLRQSFQQWEWLIINDGSTQEESLSILDHYRSMDPRIYVIDHDVNLGASAARNTGFRTAKTQYIVQLDSDNQLEPTAIEKWIWFLESYPEYSFVKGFTVGFGVRQYLWEMGFHNAEAFLVQNLVDITSTIRKSTHESVGGYDESIRGGLEDWDFWLRCASRGYWGGNIPEYLDWYRRRAKHSDRWPDWDDGKKQHEFRNKLREKYRELWNGKFPQIKPHFHMPNDYVSDEVPFDNSLQKEKPRLLLILPWLTMGGADQFNLDLLQQLTKRGWETTIATTLGGPNPWCSEFAHYTPDIFILYHFLKLVDYPRFLKYIIQSRNIELVLVSNSHLGYLMLPYLRANLPNVNFVDYCHLEEEYWNNGGYPRLALEYQELLDLNIVASKHLKEWMVERGGDPKRIKTCYINIDSAQWKPEPELRPSVRKELKVEEDIPILLYVGRILKQKQPRVFAKTMLRLKNTGINFVSVVAGDGPDLPWLRYYVRKNSLKNQVRIIGAVPNHRVKELMIASDIFFLPSEREGIALSIYEAMSCALPIVSADVGGQRELVTPECGVLVKRSNEENESKEYAEILAELLTSPRRCRELGTAGRNRVMENFHIETMGARMITLFENAKSLSLSHPRPIVSKGLGRACAQQAIEHTRLSLLTDELWNRTNFWNQRRKLSWRELTFFTIRLISNPLYNWGINRGWYWLNPLAAKTKRLILGAKE